MLKGAEAGAKTRDLCRKYGISEPTFYINWKTKYAGMTVSDTRRLKELECREAPRALHVGSYLSSSRFPHRVSGRPPLTPSALANTVESRKASMSA